MSLRIAGPDDTNAIAALFFAAGEDPRSRDLHSWGSPQSGMATELRELEHPVAVIDGDAALVLDIAPDQGRAWAWGPAVASGDREARADTLLERVLRDVPAEVTRISSFPVVASWMERWWRHRGATTSQPSHVYQAPARAPTAPDPRVRLATPADRAWIEPLHDAEFPKTYLSTEALLAPHERRRTWAVDGGYLCAEIQEDGTGYVHFLAVVPERRRRGLASRLLATAMSWLSDREVSLTVIDDNDARRLYEGAGFSLLATGQPFDLRLPVTPR